MLELSKSNFKKVVGANGIVLIECWAPGCGVCAQFDPIFEEVSEKNPDHVFARMNVLTEENLGEYFGIEHTPSLMLYRDGLLLLKQPGNFNQDSMQDIIRQAESVDMELVMADLASSEETNSTNERG